MALLMVAACSRDAGSPTAEENRQLNDAADLLNEAPANLDRIDDSALGGANSSESGDAR